MKAIDQEQLSRLFAQLGNVHVPTKTGNHHVLAPYDGQLQLDYVHTLLSPKGLFFSQTEVIYTFQAHGQDIQIQPVELEDQKAIVFGIRPCDMAGIQRLDQVFLHGDHPDPGYCQKRNNTFFITLGCSKPGPTCFCSTFGVNPTFSSQGDWHLMPMDNQFILTTNTHQGVALMGQYEGYFQEVPQHIQTTIKTLEFHLPDRDTDLFPNPLWEQMGHTCIGCGICTYICPTCHCYDLQSRSVLGSGQRYRCWDSCMYSDFTQMAGGHNPRPSGKERVRNRFLHKLQYFPQVHGEYGCTGCGRCIQRCPVHLDMAHVLAKLGAEGSC